MHILHATIGAPNFKIVSKDNRNATLTIGPLPSGYGMTLGSPLRRTLLSSLPGTAITAMKFETVLHEYSTIKGVQESVLDISLNLRSLSLKKHSKDSEMAEISVKKAGVITAADIKASSDVEILDPAQVIAHYDGSGKGFKMEFRIERGVGYNIVSNEDNAAEEDPALILINANFSPVKKVKYEVSPARVGEQTNLDQLQVEVETDGSLGASESLKLAAGILENYFQLFNKDEAYTDEDFTSSFSAIKAKEEELKTASSVVQESFTPIDILGFSQRTLNALVNGGISSVEELLKTPMSRLSQLRGFGQKAKVELEQVLKEKGCIADMPALTNSTES